MPEPQAPTEEQVQAANEAEFKRWEGDFDPKTLEVKYKNDEVPTDKKASGADSEGKDEHSNDENEEVATYDAPAPVVTVNDPGDYVAKDYSFEVTLKDGKTHKVSTPEEADKLAEDPENFETPKQLLDFIRRSQKMEVQLDRDKEKWEVQKKTFDEQSTTEQEQHETAETFANEMLYLVDKGLLPDIEDADAKQRWQTDADAWQDKEFTKTPGVKEQVELLDYLVKENERRAKAKIRPITSLIDAFNGWQLDNSKKQEVADQKAAGEARKAAGARVAGVSASNQAPYVPKGIAVGNPNVFKRSENIWSD